MAYSDKVIDHYENPRNVGTFRSEPEVDTDEVGTGLVGAPACGDVMRLEIRVKDGLIADAKFKTFGCGFVEPVYRRAMMVELRHRGVWVEQEVKYEYSIAASPSGITRPTWLWTRVSSSRSKRVRCPTR